MDLCVEKQIRAHKRGEVIVERAPPRESRPAQCAQSHDLKKEVSCMLDEPPLKPA
jgi:hypothetical protein